MLEENGPDIKKREELDPHRDQEYAQLDDDYYINKMMLEKHHFYHDDDHFKCPDCEGLGYFYAHPPDLGGLGSYLFPKKECAKCRGKGYMVRNKET
jgi:hypothetical protein